MTGEKKPFTKILIGACQSKYQNVNLAKKKKNIQFNHGIYQKKSLHIFLKSINVEQNVNDKQRSDVLIIFTSK